MPITELKDSVMVDDFVIDGKKIIRKSDKIIIPDGVKHIPIGAFKYVGVKSIEIPKSVKEIGGSAFVGSGITSITIPEGVERIEDATFQGCYALQSVTIPKSVKYIGEKAFSHCTSLKHIELPDGIELGYSAFSDCISLKEINIPKIKIIPQYCFYGCESLKKITISDGVERIGNSAFRLCFSVDYVKIPDSVDWIGEEAFSFGKCITHIKIDEFVVSIPKLSEHCRYNDIIEGKIVAYKAFQKKNDGLVCRDYVYNEGFTTEMSISGLKLCRWGFHACINPFDVFSYYYGEKGTDFEIHEVYVDKVKNQFCDDSKICCAKIKVGRKLSLSEMAEIYTNSYFHKML